MKKIAFAGLVLLVLLALAAPFVVGSVTESSWDDMTREFNKSSNGVAALETIEYDRNYFSTDVLSKLVLELPEIEEPVTVFLRSDIDHGLLGARSETRLDPERQTTWLAYFGEDAPLLVTNAGLMGNVDGQLTVPAVAEQLEQGARLEFSPLDLEFVLSDNASAVQLALTWDGMALEEGGNALQIGTVSFTEDLARLEDELWVGELGFSVSAISSQTAGGNEATFEGITLTGSTREIDDNRLRNQVDLGIENIAVGGQPFGDLRASFLADEFDIDATSATLTAANRLNEVAGANNSSEQAVEQLKLFGEFMNAVRNLMAEGLNLGIQEMVLNTPEGAVELEFSFVHPKLEAAQRENMMSLFQHSSGGLNLTMPAALMDSMPPDVQQQMGQLYQQGLIREENGELSLTIELDQMRLDVNGKTIRIPPII